MASFISFEGGEGSGKTVQTGLLKEKLDELGVPSLLFREPGSCALGQKVRSFVKDSSTRASGETELFLFAASRSELTEKVLLPRIKQPNFVLIADRFTDSTLAYQGYGRGVSLSLIERVNDAAARGLRPWRTFLLDCPRETAVERIGSPQPSLFDGGGMKARVDEDGARRFEDESEAFHRRVRDGYLALASREPSRWRVIDGSGTPDEVRKAIWSELANDEEFAELLNERSAENRRKIHLATVNGG